MVLCEPVRVFTCQSSASQCRESISAARSSALERTGRRPSRVFERPSLRCLSSRFANGYLVDGKVRENLLCCMADRKTICRKALGMKGRARQYGLPLFLLANYARGGVACERCLSRKAPRRRACVCFSHSYVHAKSGNQGRNTETLCGNKKSEMSK